MHPFVLDTFFFTAAGAALVRYNQRPTSGRGCAAAALIGFGVLTRPTILVFLLAAWWNGSDHGGLPERWHYGRHTLHHAALTLESNLDRVADRRLHGNRIHAAVGDGTSQLELRLAIADDGELRALKRAAGHGDVNDVSASDAGGMG